MSRARRWLRQTFSLAGACALTLLSLGAASQDLKYVETDQLRVVYFANAGEFIAPYATQCLVNGLDAQKARFGYVPDGGVSVLLQDFSDIGNANAIMGAPRNRLYFELSPPMLTFETYSPGERLYALANHELVHLVVGDQASSSERTARRWLGGKVAPVQEHPESIFYYYLTNPRATSPRWYQEGSAVFMETWYGGGLGRAQGGYDEMVFRAMVRDEAHFYDPLGLVSKGTEVDFQTGANAYLYGTRFLSYLAYQYSPDKLIDWLRREDGTERYYAADFERVYGKPLESAWADWIRWEQQFQATNLAAVREHPITPYTPVAKRALGAISRAYLSKDKTTLYAAVRYPGRVPYLIAWISRPARCGNSWKSTAPCRTGSRRSPTTVIRKRCSTRPTTARTARSRPWISRPASRARCCRARASATSPTTRSTGRSGACDTTTAS